jgi:hypothetical protein
LPQFNSENSNIEESNKGIICAEPKRSLKPRRLQAATSSSSSSSSSVEGMNQIQTLFFCIHQYLSDYHVSNICLNRWISSAINRSNEYVF